MLNPNIFLWVAASVSAAAAAVYPNSIKILLANGLSSFPIKGNPVFSNGPKSIPNYLIILFYGIEFLIILY